MNVNSQQQTPVIKDWLISAKQQLSNIGIPSALLDAEIILAHILKKSRTYLHAHPEQIINTPQYAIADNLLEQRLKRVPIAYIVGYREFYGRQFIVTPATLIPRPESEDIITILKQLLPPTTYPLPPTRLVDIGTGCGCLGITAKLEFPEFDVTLLDISNDAIKIAKQNAKKLSANVSIKKSDLLNSYTKKADVIIANLPYVSIDWKRSSPETNHEPSLALFAGEDGLLIIKRLIVEASNLLSSDGFLIIEADPTQHKTLTRYAKKYSFILTEILGYVIAFRLNNLFNFVEK